GRWRSFGGVTPTPLRNQRSPLLNYYSALANLMMPAQVLSAFWEGGHGLLPPPRAPSTWWRVRCPARPFSRIDMLDCAVP
ncbi:MAG: hypothetical protein ACXWWJ_04365, partial [Nitrospira sp.]